MNPFASRSIPWIAGGVALGFLAVCFFVRINRGPRYEGRTANYWVKQLVRDRSNARRALGELGPAAVPALIGAVEDKQSRVTPFLDALRPRLPSVVRRHLVSSHEAALRADRAVEILYDLGTNAAPSVPALIRDNLNRDAWEFNYAHAALLKIGEAGVPQLIRVLWNPDPRYRVAAARYLGLIGPNAGTATPALTKALNDPDTLVQTEAVVALARIGPSARSALPALQAALGARDDEFRLWAIDALWKIGRESGSTVPLLIHILQDRANSNRAKAAILLGQMGFAAAPALPALANVLQEEFSYTGVKAEESLRQIEQSMSGNAEAKR